MLKKDILRSHGLFLLGIFIALVIAYFPQISGEFLGDDVGRIQNLPTSNPFEILNQTLGDRPFLIASVWLDRFVFHFDVAGMRIENFIWVALLCLVMRLLIIELTNIFKLNVNPIWRDGLLLLFALHPLNTQAIGHVIQRGILLSSLFALISTWLLIKSKGSPKHIGWKIALLCWCLALMAKPNIAFMPIWWVILIYFVGDRKNIPYLFFFFLMLFIPVISYKWGGFNSQETVHTLSPWNYFLTQGKSIYHYFRLIIFPWPLYFIHNVGAVTDGKLFPGLAFWAAYLGSLGLIFWKSKNTVFKIFCVGCLLAFLPESSFFAIIHNFFEHRTFTPLVFLVIGISFLRINVNPKILVGSLAAVAVLYGTGTFMRSRQVRLYKDWVLNETRVEICEGGYFIYYIIHQLVIRKELDVAEKAINQVNSCMDNITRTLLNAELHVAKTSELNKEIMTEFKDVLHSDNLVVCDMRNLANEFMLKKIYEKNKEEQFCKAEEVIAHQLRFLVQNSQKCHSSIQNYFYANSACLKQLITLKRPVTDYQMLKMRTIRYSYFRQEDAKLEKDLNSAGDEEKISYLKNIFKSALKDREMMKKINLKMAEKIQ